MASMCQDIQDRLEPGLNLDKLASALRCALLAVQRTARPETEPSKVSWLDIISCFNRP